MQCKGKEGTWRTLDAHSGGKDTEDTEVTRDEEDGAWGV